MLRTVALIAFAAALSSCTEDKEAYTLYRNSVTNEHMRIHVATFDARAGHDYNMANCNIARDLFANQGGVTVRYWCERGRIK